MIFFNAQSILNKLDKILAQSHNFDIIALCETWGKSYNLSDASLSLQDQFQVFRQDRPGDQRGGGVAILTRKHLRVVQNSFHLSADNPCDVIQVHFLGKSPCRLVSIYRPPHTNAEHTEELFKVLSDTASDHQDPLVVVGDFNLPHVCWSNTAELPDRLKPHISTSGLDQLVTEPTSMDNLNILDLLFTNCASIIDDLQVVCAPVFTKHKALQISLNLGASDHPRPKLFIDYHHGNYELANNLIANADWPSILSSTDINVAYDTFIDKLHEVIQLSCPIRITNPVNRNRPPLSIRVLYRDKLLLYRAIRTDADKVTYKEFSAHVDDYVERYYDKLEELLCETGDSAGFFNYINSKLRHRSPIGPLLDPSSGELLSCPAQMSELLSQQYQGSFSVDDGHKPDLASWTGPLLTNIIFTEQNLLSIMTHLPSKATRTPDGVPPLFIKRVAQSLVGPFSCIIRLSLDSGTIPHAWRHCLIQPIFKKGNRKDSANYRPIALVSSFSKILEMLVKQSLLAHIGGHITDAQHGFLPRRSTVTSLLQSTGEWINALNLKCPVDAVYLDFAKAFDKVCHSKLIHKLEKSYGVAGRLLKWVADLLRERTQSVTIADDTSLPAPISSGVLQGSVLGPFLFVLM